MNVTHEQHVAACLENAEDARRRICGPVEILLGALRAALEHLILVERLNRGLRKEAREWEERAARPSETRCGNCAYASHILAVDGKDKCDKGWGLIVDPDTTKCSGDFWKARTP
jgi:hypothetical protein